MERPRSNKTPLIILLVVLGVLAVCVGGLVVVGIFVFSAMRTAMPFAGCILSMEGARDAVVLYAKEHEGRLPNAETWQDDAKKYLKRALEDIRHEDVPFDLKIITPDGEWGCHLPDGKMTGFSFNDELSGKKLDEIKDPYKTILLFEIETARRNAHGKFEKRPNETSPQVFGERRGWLRIPVEGTSDMGAEFGTSSGRGSIRVEN